MRGRAPLARAPTTLARPPPLPLFPSYGAEQGRPELRQAVVDRFYAHAGRAADEVFISDGSKCDIGAAGGWGRAAVEFFFGGGSVF